MKQSAYIIIVLLAVLSACKKDEKVRTSGTDTIDNTTYFSTTYYIYGFSFSQARQIATTSTTPKPDIVVYVNVDNPDAEPRLYLSADNLRPSFSKAGDYPDEASARAAFDNLKTITATQWVDLADPVVANQVWLYRSGQDTYTKIRVISTKLEKVEGVIDYGEITFQWVHQPDGSLSFP